MNGQELFNLGASALVAIFGWIIRIVWSELKFLQSNQREVERTISQSLVRKDDYRIDISDIKGMLSKIFDRLDQLR